jgi:DNA-binding response OmpR family regulator
MSLPLFELPPSSLLARPVFGFRQQRRRAPESISLDPLTREFSVDGRVVDLTFLEFELLAFLLANPRRVHSRGQLLRAVWGLDPVGETRTIDVHIARLRAKLGGVHRDRIRTVRSVGYRYIPVEV